MEMMDGLNLGCDERVNPRGQCLIQDQIFTSPSPGAVDPRARARTSAACA